jgi:hypothetical protein
MRTIEKVKELFVLGRYGWCVFVCRSGVGRGSIDGDIFHLVICVGWTGGRGRVGVLQFADFARESARLGCSHLGDV